MCIAKKWLTLFYAIFLSTANRLGISLFRFKIKKAKKKWVNALVCDKTIAIVAKIFYMVNNNYELGQRITYEQKEAVGF